MGASSSVDLRPEEVDELMAETNYEPKEIKTLYKRFRRLDRSGRGTISADDLTMIPEVVMNPLSARLMAMFEKDSDGRINFRSFVRELSFLNEKRSPAEKASHMFRLFDVDGDGFITASDLEKILSMMTGESLGKEASAEVVQRTLQSADADGDGKLSEEDFTSSLANYPWGSFTVPVKGTSRMQYFADLEREREGGQQVAE